MVDLHEMTIVRTANDFSAIARDQASFPTATGKPRMAALLARLICDGLTSANRGRIHLSNILREAPT